MSIASTHHIFLASLALLALSACGGGDEAVQPDAPVPVPTTEVSRTTSEGLWSDNGIDPLQVVLVVPASGSGYGVLVHPPASGRSPEVIRGPLLTEASTPWAASLTAVSVGLEAPRVLQAQGQLTAMTALQLTALPDLPALSLHYNPTYDQALTAQAVAGRYSGFGVSGGDRQGFDVLVAADGTLTLAGSLPDFATCRATGALQPLREGASPLRVKLTFKGPSGCPMPDGLMVEGVALFDGYLDTLLVLGMNLEGTRSVLMELTRQP
jgi:hypothetical protein